MQKNWYAVYTKPQAEKKVAASLAKKKLDVLVPMVYTKTKTFRKNKFVFEPLFKSIVFVYATQAETQVLKGTSGIINLLYWLGKPAVIDASEINAIKEFTENYRNIRLEPTSVNNEEEVNNYNGSSISIEGKLYAVKNKTVKVKLPSLGYYLTAELEEESIFVREIPAVQNYRFAHS